MIAANILTRPSTHFQGRTYLKLAEVAEALGVSQSQARLLVDEGALGPIHKTTGGHRRISASEVYQYVYGVAEESEQGSSVDGPMIVGVARVSSAGQSRAVGSSDKSSLEHQVDRIDSYCLERWGKRSDEMLKSVGSGLNFDRPELLALIEGMVSGKYKGAYIVCTDFTRLCRFGVQLIEYLAKIGGCEIVYTMDDRDEKGENETLVDDILGIMTHFTAKASGAKAKKALKVNLDEESLRDAYKMYKHEGYSYRHIAKVFTEEGRKDGKGRKYTRNVVRACLMEHWDSLESLFDSGATPSTSFDKFVSEKVRKASDSVRLTRTRLMDIYASWCNDNDLAPMSSKKVSEVTKRLQWETVLNVKGSVSFKSLSVLR